MQTKYKLQSLWIPLLLTGILAAFAACENRSSSDRDGGEERQLSQSIQLNEVETVKTNISIKAGRLDVSGGAENLVDTEIFYSKNEWKPDIEYTTTGSTGRLRIEQPDISGINFNIGNTDTNQWRIQLNDKVVQDLSISMGAGETKLDLSSLQLNSLDLNVGVGEHQINLAGTSVPRLDVNAGIGEVSLDLSGAWRNDLDASINGGIGELNLLLPSDVGIRIEVSGALGSVNAPELTKNGNVFTNEQYGKTDYVLDLDVKAGIGSVNVNVQ